MRFTLNHPSETACFISARIDESHKSHYQIAKEMGFGTIDDISMIRSGMAKMPIAKIGTFSRVLDTDPVELLSMCLHEYYPETWDSISPFLDSALTPDELAMVKALRLAVVRHRSIRARAVRKVARTFLTVFHSENLRQRPEKPVVYKPEFLRKIQAFFHFTLRKQLAFLLRPHAQYDPAKPVFQPSGETEPR